MLEPGPSDRFVHQALALASWRAARLEPEPDVVLHAGVEQVRTLVTGHPVPSQPVGVWAQVQGQPAVQRTGELRRLQSRDHAQQRGLAGAVVARERVAVAGVKNQAANIQHRARAELFSNRLDHEQRRVHFNPPSPCRNPNQKFTTRATASSMNPSAMPSAHSPLLVSSAMAVGMLRVNTAILPPSIIAPPIPVTTGPTA